MQLKNKHNSDVFLQYISLNDVNSTYVNWLNDPQVNQYLETRFQQQTLSSVTCFVADILANNSDHLFTIRSHLNGHIGNIKIGGINKHHGVGYISLFIGDKTVWGKGYAKQAIQLVSDYAFNTLQLRKLSARAYQPNIGSTKAFLSAGYKHDGIFKDHFVLHGKSCDLIQVCLFKSER
ncbi:MAG: ribosomal-protein-alanine N-acetyltransferase [Colwellia sp.]